MSQTHSGCVRRLPSVHDHTHGRDLLAWLRVCPAHTVQYRRTAHPGRPVRRGLARISGSSGPRPAEQRAGSHLRRRPSIMPRGIPNSKAAAATSSAASSSSSSGAAASDEPEFLDIDILSAGTKVHVRLVSSGICAGGPRVGPLSSAYARRLRSRSPPRWRPVCPLTPTPLHDRINKCQSPT